MKLVTAEEMQEIDRRTIEGGHVASLALMERAGAAVADAVLDELEYIEAPQVEILCGKGNNGGDGLVAARLLAASGIGVRVWLTQMEGLSADAQSNLEKLRQTDCTIGSIPAELDDPGELEGPGEPVRKHPAKALSGDGRTGEFCEALLDADLCVDSLLGTGVHNDLSARYQAIVNTMNWCCRKILAVDIPSGIDGTTGAVLGTSSWADRTVTMGLPKRGLVFHPGAARAGRLQVADIGFPESVVDSVKTPWLWMDAQAAQRLVPPLEPTAHKYQRGALLLIAGSRQYPGAAALAAEAALRIGAGIVHLVVPRSIADLVNAQLREVIVHGAPETPDGSLHSDAHALVTTLFAKVRAVAIGSGLSDADETRRFILHVLNSVPTPHVVDADALAPSMDAPTRAPRVVTPHIGEMARMLNLTTDEVAVQRVELAQQMAALQGCTVLCKGAPTVVALPDGRRIVNSTGNVGLATAGSGDVLTGILAGLLAQGATPPEAAPLAAYLHGRAAEILSEGVAPRSLLASDLLRALGWALEGISAN